MICGSLLFQECPSFLEDLWQFDRVTIDILKDVPKFWKQDSYDVRRKLLDGLKRFHARAKLESAKNEILHLALRWPAILTRTGAQH